MSRESLLIVEHLRKLSLVQSHKTAIIDESGRVTYAELIEAAMGVAAALAASGIRSGDRVAIAVRPSLVHAVVILGCLARGAVATSLNTRLTQPELRAFLQPLAPSLLICDLENEVAVRGMNANVCVLSDAHQLAAVRWRLAPLWSDAGMAREVHEDDPALIIPTGGTTGLPKGAVYTQRAIWIWAAACAFDEGRARDDHELYFSPFFHSSVLSGWMATLFSGGSVSILGSFSPEGALEAISRGANFILGPPTVFEALAAHPEFRRTPRSGVTKLRIATTAASPDFIERLMADYPAARLSHTYGASEFGPIANIRHADFVAGRLMGVGTIRPGALVTIVDEALRPLPTGAEGELVVDCPWRARSYWGRDEESRKTFLDIGVRIGDIGHLDADGWLTISGRKKEIIISGGENVFPNEVEAVLSRHPAVAGVIVYGAKDSYWGERVEAAVVLRDGESLDQGQLVEFGRRSLAGYKLPKRVWLVKQLPFTTMNKPDRMRLAHEAEQRERDAVSRQNHE